MKLTDDDKEFSKKLRAIAKELNFKYGRMYSFRYKKFDSCRYKYHFCNEEAGREFAREVNLRYPVYARMVFAESWYGIVPSVVVFRSTKKLKRS